MKFENVLDLVDAVSKSNLTAFEYSDGETTLHFETGKGAVVTEANATPVQVVEAALAPAVSEKIQSGLAVKSPLVGTFYSAPTEDAESFVNVGDTVKKGQVIAIVEAMKLMNEIESEYDGVVSKICVKNGQTVEYGQPLFEIQE